MASNRPAITTDTLGAWLLKADPGLSSVADLVRTGFATVEHRCVRRSYRTDLLAPGQPVLFWVSGRDPAIPAGLHAEGRTTGAPLPRDDDGSKLDLPVALVPLRPPILREELRLHPTLSRLEVLRMPAGSNPSFLTRSELAELRSQWPQVGVG